MTIATYKSFTYAWTDENRPSTNFGANPSALAVRTYTSPFRRWSYIKCNTMPPKGVIIVSATLRLRLRVAYETPKPQVVANYVITGGAWTASGITWNNKPSASSSIQSVGVWKNPDGSTPNNLPLEPTSILDFDVTTIVNQNVNGGRENRGWRLETSSNIFTYVTLWGAGDFSPELIVEYFVPAESPTDLSPGNPDPVNPSLISNTFPLLSASYNSSNQSPDLTGVQVEMKRGSNDFTSGTWVSEWINTTIPVVDVSTLSGSLSAQGNGDTVFWRMRVRDINNNYSVWSEILGYKNVPRGTLTITDPPDKKVTVPYPTISWSFSQPVTSPQYQVLIFGSTDNSRILWDSGRMSGSLTSISVPPGVITVNNVDHRVVVRYWDDTNRVAYSTLNTSVQPYVETEKVIKYALSDTVAPASDLVVSYSFPLPDATLTWSRSEAPDSFEIVRDGVTIATDLSAAFLSTGATTYRWVDTTAPVGQTHEWQVRSEVGGVTSSGNPRYTNITESNLAWIVDKDNDIYVPIAGEAPVSSSLYEQGAVYEPLNSGYKVRITRALGGYQGSVSGSLCGECLGDGTTMTELKSKMLEIRSRPGKTLYLFIADIAIPVVVYNINVSPQYGARFNQTNAVSFDFHEVQENA